MTTLTLVTDDTLESGVGGVVFVGVTVDDSTRPVFKSADGTRLAATLDGLGVWTASWATSRTGSFPITVTAGDASPVMVAVTVEDDGPTPPGPGDYFIDETLAAIAADVDSAFHGYLSGRFAGKQLALATAAHVQGHSYVDDEGIGYVTPGVNDAKTLLRAGLHLPIADHAVGGTALYNSLSADANWTSLGRDLRRNVSYEELGGLALLVYLMNDIANLGLDADALIPFAHALRYAIALNRAGGIGTIHDQVEFDDGGGVWSTAANVPFVGADVAYTLDNGAKFTITTPDDWTGGYVTPAFMTWGDGGGATFVGSDDADGYDIDTHDFGAAGCRTVGVLRVPAGPGQSFTWTVEDADGATGGMFFDWLAEAPDETGCWVGAVKQPKPRDYDGYDEAPFKPTDAAVTIGNDLIQSVVDEFGPRVFAIDTSAMDHSTVYFPVGNVHPVAPGVAKFVETIVTAVLEHCTPVAAPVDLPTVPAEPPPGWEAYTPVVSGTGSAKGNGTTSGAFIDRDDSTVDFYAQFILGSTSAVGSAIELSLPAAALGPESILALEVGVEDAGTGFFPLWPIVLDPGKAILLTFTGASVSTAVPITWAVNDVIRLRGRFRRA